MRATFIASEIGIGLRRNLVMTVAVVIVTAISLFFMGLGLLARAQVDTMKTYWYDRVEVSVFLCGEGSIDTPTCAAGEVTQQQKDAIYADLVAMPEVENVIYESKEEAFARFQEQYEDSAISENVEVSQMPESYRVKLVDPEQFQVVADAFTTREGVEQVQDEKALFERLFDVLGTIQLIAFGLAVFQLVAATLLIAVTIRVAAFSRRRETGIMRLVGASGLYIQLPFILEGALAGLAGGLLAVGGIAAVQQFLIEKLASGGSGFDFVEWADIVPIMGVIVLLGVALSALASFVTLLKYLRV